MELETKSRIEEAVLAILKSADMDSMMEYKVRSMATENVGLHLGLDLSSPDHKRFVSGVVESFLLAKQSLRYLHGYPQLGAMNIFRLAGDMTHLLTVLVLLLKIHNIKSCEE